MRSRIDHLVITAPSLAAGVEYLRDALGVSPQPGGEHALMGTHNCLLKLGERLYLEVIAVNPDAPAPQRPRWFELDAPQASRTVRLATWVARTDDIRSAAAASPAPLGAIEPLRRGQYEWLISIPPDGGLPLDGIAPALIQWTSDAHPAAALDDRGCSLLRLQGFHSRADRVAALLQAIGFEGKFSVSPQPAGEQPHLVAQLQTSTGVVQLGGSGRSD